MSSVDSLVDDLKPSGKPVVVALVVSVLCLAAPSLMAQGLPSADELESSETETTSEEESGDSEEAAAEESASAEGEEEASGEEAAGEEAAGEETAEGEKSAKEGESAESGESAEKAATSEGESGGQEEAEEKKEDDKPGKIVNTETKTEKEVEGRGAVEGDPRWVQSGVNADGVPGFQHITSVKPRKANTYNVSFFGSVMGGQNIVRAGDENTFASGQLNVHAQPIEYFSTNIGLEARNNVNNFGRPEAMLSQGDLSLDLRGHYSALEYLHIGADLGLDFPTGFGSAGIDFAGTSVTPRILSTFEVNPLVADAEIPLKAHLNFGYRVDNTEKTVPNDVELTRVERFAHQISAYNSLELGIGVEYDVPYVSPFFAWNVRFPVAGPDDICGGGSALQCASEEGFKSFPDTLSLGLRGEPVDQLALHAGVDLGLTTRDAAGLPVTAPYTVVVGASWNIDPQPRVERVTKTIEKTRLVKEMPERGRFVGEVVDAKSDLPVGGAQIEYPDNGHSPQMTGKQNGQFRSYGFEPESKVAIRISHPDYHAKTIEVAVAKGEKNQRIKLKPKPRSGKVTGTVTGPDGSAVSGARVRLAGPETVEVRTDTAGEFTAEVKGGSYTVGVDAPKHFAVQKAISVEAGAEQPMEISLNKGGGDDSLVEVKGDKIEIDEKISFGGGSARIQGNSFKVLNAVASAIIAHPDIKKVEIGGHTDDVGSKSANMTLSEKRAKAVYDYLVKKGVDAGRLVSKGYGPTQPMVPNISNRNRRLNRRVEFKIIER